MVSVGVDGGREVVLELEEVLGHREGQVETGHDGVEEELFDLLQRDYRRSKSGTWWNRLSGQGQRSTRREAKIAHDRTHRVALTMKARGTCLRLARVTLIAC